MTKFGEREGGGRIKGIVLGGGTVILAPSIWATMREEGFTPSLIRRFLEKCRDTPLGEDCYDCQGPHDGNLVQMRVEVTRSLGNEADMILVDRIWVRRGAWGDDL